MFGLFDGLQKSVGNAFDVGAGVLTLGEYGDVSKASISKLIADGVEIATIATVLDTSVEIIEQVAKEGADC